ncbi:GAF and ANTAR domain-containing protein [Nakamurella flavida]|uniref:GAF and ANTAR domain-containing protein n=1 Tax=Nakamurella flavida TaxID=363630 RepID=A0A938YN19_9ACTN|nr:GAF and ANTAR domain-containing protein [Nakamurella flavida]MBM9477723.1 GAF and ANTAR domain-containing protein [Nakamurella flavida]MDP9779275.1 GAF domain-containing protein [Nakamurella flavida]
MTAPDFSPRSAAAGVELARSLADNPEVTQALHALVEMALAAGICDEASVTLVGKDGSVDSAAVSSPSAGEADALQYELGEGPCLRAAETSGVWVVPDTRSDARFPRWGPAAADSGVGATVSVHLFTERRALGGLNLYRAAAGPISEDDIEAARMVGAHASVTLARLRTERELWRAVDARHLIGQAQGILIERLGLTPERAFAVLKRYSSDHNRKLNDVARDLVNTGQLPGQARPAARADVDLQDADSAG